MITSIVFAVTLLIVNFSWAYATVKKDEMIEAERKEWQVERQKLLDRIQAPSFDHLKQAEIRLEKVKNEPKETIKLEVV